MSRVSRAGVLAAYRDGITVICELAAQLTAANWLAGTPCAEWHLHAWDLARSLGKDYRPADPEIVLAAWRAGMPQLWPAPAGRDLATGDADDPWHFLLIASGRDQGWPQVLEWPAALLGRPARLRSRRGDGVKSSIRDL